MADPLITRGAPEDGTSDDQVGHCEHPDCLSFSAVAVTCKYRADGYVFVDSCFCHLYWAICTAKAMAPEGVESAVFTMQLHD
jgi:hypothetical protein